MAVCGCVWLTDHCSVTETVVMTYGNVWLCLIDWSLQCDWNCCRDLWQCVAVFDWLIIAVWLKLLSWLVAVYGCVWLTDHCSVTETVVVTYGNVWLCLIDWSLQCDWNCCRDLWQCVAVFHSLIIAVWLKLLSWLMAVCGCVWLTDHCSVTETVVVTYGNV